MPPVDRYMPRLRIDSVSKTYPNVVANDSVSLSVAAGEIHALLGENGAGKSTLVKMVYGVTQPTSGTIYWEGRPVQVASPAHARALGIGMVFQHFSLFETLTVAQNMALLLPEEASLKSLSNKIRGVSERYGLPIDPEQYVHDLSVGERQRVEIIRCLLQQPKLLIMDEPTSVLAPAAVERLFDTLRQIAAEGCAILYISHKLDEILALCDHATVLREGRVTGQCTIAEETAGSLARLMIGHDFEALARSTKQVGDVLISLQDVSLRLPQTGAASLDAVDLDLRAGQVVGLAGISGNGQRELCGLLSGELRPTAGEIRWRDELINSLGVEQRRQLGMCYVPEDRLGMGALPDMSLVENGLLTASAKAGLVSNGLVNQQRAQAFAQHCIETFQVKAAGPHAVARSLSGGNLQKFLMAREILQNPKVLICAQPTWGVDVGAAAFIRQSLIDLARQGCAVLVISEDLDELFEVSDQIAVIAQGRLSPLVSIEKTHVQEIGLWMSGLWPTHPPITTSV